MIAVPVIKPLTYISPSTYMAWEKCQNRVYQAKMAGHKFQLRKSSKAAAIGTAVDAFVKHAILTRRKEDFPETKGLSYIFSKMVLEDGLDKEAIVKEGRAITQGLIERKILDEFIDPNNKVQLDIEGYRICDGVPLLGIIDISINRIPTDLKTRGFGKDAKTYSHGGYVRKLTRDGMRKQGMPELLELKSRAWATQLYFYAKILEMQTPQCRIIEVCNQMNGQFEVAQHDSKFSSTFTTEIDRGIEAMWSTVSGLDIEIEEPKPGWHCTEYNSLCEVANRCSKYMSQLSAEVKANE